MRQANRPFLIGGDPAYVVLKKWERVGICCTLDATGTDVVVTNYTWPKPGTTETHPVPEIALDELGQWYDEILSHLRYWKATREQVERIWVRHSTAESLHKISQ